MGAEAIAGVLSRIASIESRFETDTSLAQTGAIPVVDDGVAFEPFGNVYQQAVQARGAVGPAASQDFSSFTGVTATGLNTGVLGAPGTTLGATSSAKVNAAINGVATTPGARPVGGYGKLPIPGPLVGMDNGKLPAGTLTPLATQPGHQLYAPAAASWNNLVAAARADGIEMRITDSYRDYAEQVDLVRRKGLYSEGGLGAKPGTSNHGWGMAVDADVTDPQTLQWLKTNGPRFGWVESVPREPWHWEFRPEQV